MTGALKSVCFANLSATIVANGNTVEDPTIDIWFPSLAVVEVISVKEMTRKLAPILKIVFIKILLNIDE